MRYSILLLCCFLISCGDGAKQSQKAQEKTVVVQKSKLHKTLNFTGMVLPRRESTLTSPMDAVVEKMPYHYGEQVKAGEEVFVLNSHELQKQYHDILTDYLKAKDNYSVARAKFNGTLELWQAGLIPKNQFLSEKSSLNTTRLTLMQSKHKLMDMLKKTGDTSYQQVSHLNFAEFDKVRLALKSKHNLIYLKSPMEGVLLYPPKGNEDKTFRVGIGSQVKSGQVLALIGDLSGIRIEIDVPEVDIDKIKRGMKAIVRGVAFQNHELKGQLAGINNQAAITSGSTLPSFTARVEVNGLDAVQQSFIKVGMSANIELLVEPIEKIMLPISALHQSHGKSMVYVRQPNGALSERLVVTGAAEAGRVAIESGLRVGEVVVYE